MMGKSYQRKNNRSRRKMQKLDGQVVTVNLAGGKAAFQMVLPMSEMLFDAAKAIEQTASQAGLLMMKALLLGLLRAITSQTGIAGQFPADSAGMYAQFDGNLILFFSCLLHRINLDTIFFGELSVLSHKCSLTEATKLQ